MEPQRSSNDPSPTRRMPHVPPPPPYAPTPRDRTAVWVRVLTLLVLAPLWYFVAVTVWSMLEVPKGRATGGAVLGAGCLIVAAVLVAVVLWMPSNRARKVLRVQLAVSSLGAVVAAYGLMFLVP
ncbi:hypothetical protein ACIO3O_06295 [Streptomyces sp. NPDC087440]|uniref:hypothetical protein n=1 Tax=Streptomyces sp. NPDC087440 TaxID=3365790 RepID=UPI003824789F